MFYRKFYQFHHRNGPPRSNIQADKSRPSFKVPKDPSRAATELEHKTDDASNGHADLRRRDMNGVHCFRNKLHDSDRNAAIADAKSKEK